MRVAHYLNCCVYQHPVTIIFLVFFLPHSHLFLQIKKNKDKRWGKKRMFRKLVLKIIKRMVWEIEISHLSEKTE